MIQQRKHFCIYLLEVLHELGVGLLALEALQVLLPVRQHRVDVRLVLDRQL
jgi:hypothetical protein